LKFVDPLYESNLIAFVGSDNNFNFPSSQVVFWDDIKKRKIAMILLKEIVHSVKFCKEAVYVILKLKVN